LFMALSLVGVTSPVWPCRASCTDPIRPPLTGMLVPGTGDAGPEDPAGRPVRFWFYLYQSVDI